MSPKNKKKLELIRKKLDKLDNKFIDLIKVRTNLVNEVVKLKQFKKEIIDKKRISVVLKKIHKKSIKKKIDPKITNRIWKNMIWSYINYEKKIFNSKK
jgi:chorismate mutase